MNQPLTLDSLLASMKQMTKSASEEEKKDEKSDKESEGDKESSKESDKKDEGDSKKSDDEKTDKTDKDEKKDEKSLPAFLKKEAQATGEALAREIMQKVASSTIPSTINKDSDMNKQAQEAGVAMAQSLLEKLAGAGDLNTSNGIAPEGVPNKNQTDLAQLVAEDDGKIKPQPGLGGSVNQILDAIVQDTIGQGAASFDQVHSTGVAAAEGATVDAAIPNQVQTDEQEKAAAVSALVNDGLDFESAVSLVKEAGEALAHEHEMQVKQAAIGALMDRGVDFESAVALVKSASSKEDEHSTVYRGARALGRGALTGLGGALAGGAGGAGVGALAAKALGKDVRLGAALGGAWGLYAGNAAGSLHGTGKSVRNQIAESHQKQAGALQVVQAAAKPGLSRAAKIGIGAGVGAAALGAGGYALAREKKAALDALVGAGVDFDMAASLVSAKSQELYGQ
jgi:hypothetical protein